ncbi:hypothetical protein HWB05_gp152 [Streptomyces phage BRock]|uniref:Uncharacterized protein n=1 Tax=Streptomyces phage BRock TaxID=1913591 RepID=A0A1J0GW62_9CAUD|nr:hypothetical protein HWB05_gp152 [Streptomyces phage BRock]APC46414.1 hypothetical protein [Streptomyces phage BRock]
MAASRAKSGTTTANTAVTIKFPQYFANITVVNRSTGEVLWARTDGYDPAVAGDDAFPVLSQQSLTFGNGVLSQEPVVRVTSGTLVTLISAGVCEYTVYAT